MNADEAQKCLMVARRLLAEVSSDICTHAT